MNASGASTRLADPALPLGKAFRRSLIAILPLLAALTGVQAVLWGTAGLQVSLGILEFLAAVIIGTVVHELTHALCWALLGRQPLSTLSFGIQWRTLSPYAHISAPIDVRAYRIGMAMPGILVGGIPVLVGLATGSGNWFWFGQLFLFGAGADAIAVWLARGLPRGTLVQDHDEQAGCRIVSVPDSG